MREQGSFAVGKIVSFALIFIIFGTGLCAFGYMQGGAFNNDVTMAGLHFDIGFNGIKIEPGTGRSSNFASAATLGGTDYYEEYGKLEKLEIKVGVCEIKVIGGDTASLEGSNLKDNEFTIDYRNDKLTIKQKNKNDLLSFTEDESPKLILTLPSDIMLKDIDISNGVGSLVMYDLITEELEINVGVGSVKIDGMIAEEINIKGGVGTVTAEGLTAKNLTVKGGVGKIDITECLVDGDISLKGGVGNITLDLINAADEFDFDIDSGLGSVTLNGKSLSKNYKSSSSSNTGKIKASSGVGSISISTNQ